MLEKRPYCTYKPNKPLDKVSSFRPISLLSCVSKVLEKIIAKRIMWFVLKNQHISNNQVAFKAGQGTIDALLHFELYLATALSYKNHTEVLSLDFEKAFDRIGVHVVLRQLNKWRVGKKVYAFVKSFLTKRTFRVKINGKYSDRTSLYNGIPQGSPISVVFFIIAFDEISKILQKYQLHHSIYADDVLIFSKNNGLLESQHKFSKILDDIAVWSEGSGASISYEKCNIIHICRKKNYPDYDFIYNNVVIKNVKQLKILGITFNKTLNFKQHCLDLRKKLNSRLNIIKYLTSKNSRIHTESLINVTRSLILGVIDYGLSIYGQCAKTTRRLVITSYHTAIRRSLRAFPTTPIKNLLAESGLPSIDERFKQSTLRLIPKLYLTKNSILHKDVKNVITKKRVMKRPSAIFNALQQAKEIDIFCKPTIKRANLVPPWKLPNTIFITKLLDYPKQSTNSIIYKETFLDIRDQLKKDGWKLIFTDGSKISHSSSFAVVTEEGNIITKGLLFSYNSVFAAELTAINVAIKHAVANKGKYVICTDSMSSIKSLQNLRNEESLVEHSRDMLIKYFSKIKVMWIPGHCGIRGNEHADSAAKEVYESPSICFGSFVKSDIIRQVNVYMRGLTMSNWQTHNHIYKLYNQNCCKPVFPASSTTDQQKIFTRLRLGHTKITHEHLLKREPSPICLECKCSLSINHILEFCPKYCNVRLNMFRNKKPTDLLKNCNLENIETIYKYIYQCKLLQQI
uniref:RNA-directed DNA polymerase from mobile element jockey n=1 Tax=Ceratitis capitata TaxID=7213 RepID=W8B1H2_CERCA